MIGEILLIGVAGALALVVAVLFYKGLDIPPECCAPSAVVTMRVDIESELIQ